MRRSKVLAVVPLLLLAASARADMVWPALYLETRLFSWWAIGIGLVAEFFFVQRLFSLRARRAAFATIIANTVSSVAGILLIPLAGIVWELFPGLLYMRILKWGTFNPVTWAATFVLACLVTTAIEAAVYKMGFKFTVRRQEFTWLVVANAVSVGVAFVTLFISPIES